MTLTSQRLEPIDNRAGASVSSMASSTPRGCLTLRSASVADRDRIREFLVGLSSRTLYQRFLTGMSEPTPSLVAYLATGGGRGAALLAQIDGVVVGHGLWAPVVTQAGGTRRAAEIAIVVGDRHQRRGVGTALAQGLLAELARDGYVWARVVTAADNRAVLRMIARQDPSARPDRDGPTYTYDLPIPAHLARAPRSA